MNRFLFCDCETRSFADLPKCGAWRYSEHETTDCLCIAWALDGAPVDVDKPGAAVSFRKKPAPDIVFVARNAPFEYAIFKNVLIPRYGFHPDYADPSRWLCTAALSRMHGLPASLESSADYLNKKWKKLPDGKRLIGLYSIPATNRKTGERYFREIPPDDWKRMLEYNVIDVESDREAFATLRKLPNFAVEEAAYRHDFCMNINGIRIDTKGLEKLVGVIERATERAMNDQRKYTVTWKDKNGAEFSGPLNVRSVPKLKAWLSEKGFDIDDTRIETLEAIYDETADEEIKEVLSFRFFLAKASLKKYRAAADRVSPDGRLRYFLKYFGAHPGRFAGEGFQVHNLPKSKWEKGVKPDKEIAKLIKAIDDNTGYKELVELGKKILPGLIIPDKGDVFLSGDFAAVEARGIAWLAGCKKMLTAFVSGADLYVDMAKAIDRRKPDRQLGKRVILGCLASGTNILTKDSGWKKIETVTKNDLLWDGEQWVKSGGIQATGLKNVIRIGTSSTYATPGHWFLSSGVWRTAVETVSDGATIRPLSEQKTLDVKSFPENFIGGPNAVSLCAAYAELKKNAASINFGAVKTYFAPVVLSHVMDSAAETLTDAQTSWLIQNLESVGQHVSTILRRDATTLIVKTSRGMAVAGFNAASSPLELFWNTLLRYAGLTNGDSPWTELITMDTMSPETYELLAKKLTIKTAPTFDIIDAGRNKRFLTDAGIAHNCGYGMGIDKFHAVCIKAGENMPRELAERAVTAYREGFPEIPRFWYALEEAFRLTWTTKRAHVVGVLRFERGGNYIRVKLPSGRFLYYHQVKIDADGQLSYMNFGKRGARVNIWGGVLAENITQAVCRDILTDRMQALEVAGLPVRLHVHDEIVVEVPTKSAKTKQKTFDKILNTAPAWAQGFPLKTTSEITERYHK